MGETWAAILSKLIAKEDLTQQQASWAMNEILSGTATAAQISAFAVALRAKGEKAIEVEALAQTMLANATAIDLSDQAVDIVGTGGDRSNTVNISTMAAILAAALGIPVVKHGNRAASSACGAADCLETLGVKITLDPQVQSEVMVKAGIVFLFAPLYHPSLRFAAAPRKEISIPTIFNFLGPLVNPAKPMAQAVGCANLKMAPLMADIYTSRGARGFVFHGNDGLDELTTQDISRLWVFRDGQQVEMDFDPRDLGIARSSLVDLTGGNPQLNAEILKETFSGKPGAVRDIVALNTAAALLAYQGPDLRIPIAEQLVEPFEKALAALDEGLALRKLAQWVDISQSY